ncbi:MAG: hypothetical protein J5984_06320 [Clostridia bacterium]|nr:hypothetical protein [Clostridia bacterium]
MLKDLLTPIVVWYSETFSAFVEMLYNFFMSLNFDMLSLCPIDISWIFTIVALGVCLFYVIKKRYPIVTDDMNIDYALYAAILLLGIFYLTTYYAKIRISSEFFITFSFLTSVLFARYFSPILSFFFGILQYLMIYLLNPYIFIPQIALTYGFGCMVYGIFHYNRKVSFMSCIYSKLIVNTVGNLLITSTAYLFAYKQLSFAYLFALYLGKTIFPFVINILLMYGLLAVVDKVIHYIRFAGREEEEFDEDDYEE